MPNFNFKQWWSNAFSGRRARKSDGTQGNCESMEHVAVSRRTTDEQALIPDQEQHCLGYATPLQVFNTNHGMVAVTHGSAYNGSLLYPGACDEVLKYANIQLNTEEFCAQLRKETLDIDECVFEAASWQEQRKVADWFEDMVDDIKQRGLVRKPGVFEYTLFTVSTAGAIAGWIAGGPVGSIIGSKTASVAVGVGFGIKEIADKYVQKLGSQEQPVAHYELSENPATDPLLASRDDKRTMSISQFELEQSSTDLLRTTMYANHAH